MSSVHDRDGVRRVREALERAGVAAEIRVQERSSHSAAEAAAALDVGVGQIASSLVFRAMDGSPILVITSGGHRVDTGLVASQLGAERLERADADFVKRWSGFSIGGVSPLGWAPAPPGERTGAGYPVELTVLIDVALDGYDVIWAAAGHPHAVFPTTYDELRRATGARPVRVAPEP
jgi:prolyl-tRNA editing enzyme YbaK/EbsC (Cys-tRNA(Pro) deacylase)